MKYETKWNGTRTQSCITMFDKRIIIPHASKYLILSLQCYWNIKFTSEPNLQTFIASTVMTHWRNKEANCMEA